jgi:hypothetical protein
MDTYGILQIFSCLVFRFRHLFGFLRGQRGQASVNQSVNQSVKLPMGAFGRLNPTASYASYCGRMMPHGSSWDGCGLLGENSSEDEELGKRHVPDMSCATPLECNASQLPKTLSKSG